MMKKINQSIDNYHSFSSIINSIQNSPLFVKVDVVYYRLYVQNMQPALRDVLLRVDVACKVASTMTEAKNYALSNRQRV